MASDQDKKINSFAIRSFRDVADQDYIVARLACRADLMSQFMWAAQQAIEKYLKGILCLHRIPAVDLGHNVPAAVALLKRLPFDVELDEQSAKTIQHIGVYGPYRYLEAPWIVVGYVLPRLDRAIWELRRYCQAINHERLNTSGVDPRFEESIKQSKSQMPQRFKIPGGLLETIVGKKDHPARSALVWQNQYYGSSTRKQITAPWKLSGANPPLMHHPEILDEVAHLVHIPAIVRRACKDVWLPAKQKRDSNA